MLTFVLVCFISYSFGNIDYWRVKNHESPLFVINWTGFFDGGTFVGCGFGYTVVANHGIKYSMEHPQTGRSYYWTVGPELDFWFFPFFNKSDLKFKQEEFLKSS
jgi:hypothetical protein